MKNFEILLNNFRQHKKSRTQKHAHYPDRFPVPEGKIEWEETFPEYKPEEYNDSVVLDSNTSWADPQDVHLLKKDFISHEGSIRTNKDGRPLNPMGRTGITGRGILGKWGANFAVDGVITTITPNAKLQVLTITRSDTGEMAFPGGMVDNGETEREAHNRELEEELSMSAHVLSDPLYEKIIYKGYVDDPRNTDNAWLETTAFHTHISFETASMMELKAGDDAKGFQWTTVTPENIRNFYASHGLTLFIALKELSTWDYTFGSGQMQLILQKILIS
jgi:ADP-ribose pyrophosphatase